MLEFVLVAIIFVLTVLIMWIYYSLNLKLKHQMELYGKQEELMDEKWKKKWAADEKKLSKKIADRQRSTLRGQAIQNIVTLLKDVFPYNPSDARFIGDPIDFVIFDGYSESRDSDSSKEVTIILGDVKTGKSGLSTPQKRIKKAIDEKRVTWKTFQLPDV